MSEPFSVLGSALRDDEGLVRAVASGRRKGLEPPAWRRVELRYVDLKAGRHLQVVRYDDQQAHTANHAAGAAAGAAVEELIALPFGTWHVETATATHQLRVTKKGEPLLHTKRRTAPVEPDRGHDREKSRLLEESDPLFAALGLSDADGRIKPSRRAKFRQVQEFVRLLDDCVGEAIAQGKLRRPTVQRPLRVVDLGCGNGYLTAAAHRVLAGVRGLPVQVIGADVKEQSRDHGTALAATLGVSDSLTFVAGSIADVEVDPAPEVVLALHACDTATDDALARAVGWGAAVVLAAPCCHHDVAAQLRRADAPAPYAALLRDGIVRERFADTLTDTLRASLLRLEGYRVDVVEFIGSEHTPRNTLLRAVRKGPRVSGGAEAAEYDALVGAWGLTPRLGVLLDR
ncbi:class I SAM-dependent methyltransferase [Nocardioides acrostichi]|uniref:SAM-dependent methyltransferase n=1 Tax=Nocardioides acrostichi TaxID=2784339 RepID=A0A930V3B8_9ACTN|nr:SAM-dependent methyltransferase [Nocardioides acrostichi]MBF4162439.1 SAM-dependent methyltransferase [Nocardioides acrostichi]